jgi:hypothetical protein
MHSFASVMCVIMVFRNDVALGHIGSGPRQLLGSESWVGSFKLVALGKSYLHI